MLPGWLELVIFSGKRFLARHYVSFFLILVIGYFAYHGYYGQRGFLAKQSYNALLAEKKAELEELRSERQKLQKLVEALQPGQTEQDLLEEKLYEAGFVKENEFLIKIPDVE